MTQNFSIFSVVAGSRICNARCPFCISRMTPIQGITTVEPAVNWQRFVTACRFARNHGVSTAMITSKGEPTLYPEQISAYLTKLNEYGFAPVELQTNGIRMATGDLNEQYLKSWSLSGLSLVAISIVHYEPARNKEIYLPHRKQYIDLPKLIEKLHSFDLSVRLSTVLLDGFIDSGEKLEELIAFARASKVEQLTVRPVNKPEIGESREVFDWTKNHALKQKQVASMKGFLDNEGVVLLKTAYGATLYDVKGQNVMFSNCLTIDPDQEEIRQLIWFPDDIGHLKFDWQYEGASIF